MELLLFVFISQILVYHVIAENSSIVDCEDGDADYFKWEDWYVSHPSFDSFSGFLRNLTWTKCYTECTDMTDSACECILNIGTVTCNIHDELKTVSSEIPYPYGVRYLSWAYSTLHDIKPGSFAMFGSTLEELYLNNMRLTYLGTGVFSNLTRLELLWMNDNVLNGIDPDLFEGLINLKKLRLDINKLETLEPTVFEGLVNLELLDVRYNKLTMISFKVLSGLGELFTLDLDNNALVELPKNVFDPVVNLSLLSISNNKLQKINYGLFNELRNLFTLELNNNGLQEIEPGAFNITDSDLRYLELKDNTLARLEPDVFQDMKYLQELFLSNNTLISLHSDIFESQTHLQYLHLDLNQLRYLPHDIFRTMHKLKSLNISSNHLLRIPSGLFLQCGVKLEVLDLGKNPLEWIEDRSLSVINDRTKLFVTRFSTCCYTSAHCLYDVAPSPYLTCKRLLPSQLLRIAIWFISILTIFTNVCALYFTLRQKRRSIQSFLISNLSISDFLMGIYLVTLLAVDLYYKDYFPAHSDSWRSSVLCRIAGALSVLSSEGSAFFIMLISFDRFLGVKYTFSRYRLGTRSVRLTALSMWLVALALSITSFAFSKTDSDFYSVSEVCIGLPISRKSTFVKTNETISIQAEWHPYFGKRNIAEYAKINSNASMFFSIATFTGLNLLCFFIVGYCYVSIFVEVRKSTKKSGRSPNANEEIRMAMKMSLIVLTDFCCWVPIGVLSILVQAGVVEIAPTAYAWIATFVLPINSSINPLLYTLGSMLSNKIKFLREGRSSPRTTVATIQLG